ncbi:MAG: DotA/TraY family protein [Rhodospirillales bacterium]|nr:DotA/TraY family protein [Rhodospirillales bacterium]
MIRKRQIVSYALLPGILPRIWDLFSSGFAQLALMVAVIYRNIGLLPAGHPYLKPVNYGKYGIRHVIAEASSGIRYDRQNIDKVIIHFTIIIGIVLLILQICLVVLSLVSLPVFATPWQLTFLTTPLGPDQDLAFIVLDRVFGIMNFTGTAGFFDSCYSTAVACLDSRNNVIPTPAAFPQPFHLALHQFFGFYTLGIAFLSMVVILYYVVAIIGESITSGRPFGQRFNKGWYLPRLIMFFALIAPMNLGPGGNNVGINGAQFITLAIAKWGSNMATNAWDRIFLPNAVLNPFIDTPLGRAETLVAIPNAPEMATLTQFLFVARMCMIAQQIMYNRTDIDHLNIFLVREENPNITDAMVGFALPTVPGSGGNALYYFEPGPLPFFDEAVRFSRFSKVIMRFGHYNPPGGVAGDPNDPPDAYDNDWGYVKPVCGELVFDPTAPSAVNLASPLIDTNRGDPVTTGFGSVAYGDLEIDPHGYDVLGGNLGLGTHGILEIYYQMIEQYFYQDPYFDELAHCMLKSILPYDHDSACVDMDFTSWIPIFPISRWGSIDLVRRNITYYNNSVKAAITGMWWQPNEVPFQVTSYTGPPAPGWTGLAGWAGYRVLPPTDYNFVTQMRLKYDFSLPLEVRRLGWAGAALWYHEIAQVNGMFMSAVQGLPRPTKYPELMEMIAQQHAAQETNVSWVNRFNPLLSDGQLATLPNPGDQYIAAALWAGYKMWGQDSVQSSTQTRGTKSVVIDTINMIFGTEGLYDLLEGMQQGPAADGRTLNVHPLALLSSLGKGILDAALRNLLIGVVGQGIGEFVNEQGVGDLAKLFGDTASRIALIGVSIGFVLYYVLPLLPFIYFFFGFSGWIKSVFEAMVAMPLWAVAHIKIDGEGLPGPWATNGYFLLFEIFLRPTLLIFGLIASLQVFTALVNGLNDSFHMVVLNAAGYDIEQNLTSPSFSLPLSNPAGPQGTIDFLRGPIDEFFYTVIYAIIVYMLALSNFKLIDAIPNQILRWMGATVSTFKENAGDPAQGLAGKMYRTGEITRAQLMEMIGNIKGTGKMFGTDDVTGTAIKFGLNN